MNSQTHVVNSSGSSAATTLIVLLLLAVIASLSIYLQNRLPAAATENAPATEFSAARALQKLRIISARPHPIGSQEHETVRDYIFRELSNLGLSPETQRTVAVNTRWGSPFVAATVQNVLTRIKGTNSTRAVLLAAHYDSVPTSFGASDDGAGVVTLLETARALKANGPLKNDVILLFSDGEEVGLLGANAFTTHPWAKDVAVFMNFEARGNTGPVVMFETSNGNNNLIREFDQAAPRSMASSVFYEIYKLLPNDTDFTVLNRTGAQGLNFAYLNGINHYHTWLDNIQEINPRTLQDLGSNALALTKHFANDDLGAKTTNAVYFNVLGAVFIHYPPLVNIVFLVLTVLLFIIVVWQGFKSKQLTFFGIVWGFLALLVTVIVSALITWLAWWLILKIRPAIFSVPWSEPYNSNIFRVAFVLLALGLTSIIYLLIRRQADWRTLTVGASLWWLILAVSVTLLIPGASYLFTLPLLFLLVGLTIVFFSRNPESIASQLELAVAMLPAVIFWAPLIYVVFVALTLNSAWMVTICAALLFGLLLPAIVQAINVWRWLIPSVLVITSLILLIVGIADISFDKREPKMDNLFYGLNADTGQAFFASSDSKTDEWTTQFLSSNVQRGTMPEFFPGSPRVFWKSTASAAPLAGPQASVTTDHTENNVRTLSFRISSPRRAPVIAIYTAPDIIVSDASVDGKKAFRETSDPSQPSPPMRNWGLQFYALPVEGVEVSLKLQAGKPFKMVLVDRSYGLPEIAGAAAKPRPDYIIPTPYAISDATLVSKSFSF
ncbi:MAG TPA: M20/M25/M40 family metallo-hydrolase [Pyrinomonadaceae bacterium]|nr:M20/M25/M40 family metallo-hydrolase [Pyrinomonadaceae bacterium]